MNTEAPTKAMKTAAAVALCLLIAPGLVRAQFTYQVRSNANWITGYTGPSGPVDIPSTANGLPVVGIGVNAFAAKAITAVTIPSSITNIDMLAFYSCSSLTSIVLSNGLISIGLYSFSNCTNLQSVSISDTVVVLGDYCFALCTRLQSVRFGARVSQIWPFAFAYAALASATIPASVTNIGNAAFQFAPSLVSMCFAGDAPTVNNSFLGNNNLTIYYALSAKGWGSLLGGRPAIPWTVSNPANTAGLVGGRFGFTIVGPAGAPFVVDASTNLLDWSSVLPASIENSGYRFTDPQWSSFTRRFYRIRMP
jgi:hypothetical protein